MTNLISKISVSVFIFMLFAEIGIAKTYKWVDENGVMHFTDDYTSVPDKYRQSGTDDSIPNSNKSAYDLAHEAFLQIEENAYDTEELRDAFYKIKKAHEINNKEPWVYLASSLMTLVNGYTIGDWCCLPH